MTKNESLDQLFDYILKIKNNEGTYNDFKTYEALIKQMTFMDLFDLFNRLLTLDQPKEILPYLDKLIHVFAQGLTSQKRDLPHEGILAFLHQENNAMKLKLNEIQSILHDSHLHTDPNVLLPLFTDLQGFNEHYRKIQSVVFPTLERADERCSGLKIMWSLQDQTRIYLKQILHGLPLLNDLNQEMIILIGNYFFAAFGLIEKEELILFQVCLELLNQNDLELMANECAEFEACFIPPLVKRKNINDFIPKAFFSTESGNLNQTQMISMLNALPIAITLIDEKDKVIYFNQTSDRTFPRSAAVIGRAVQNCHPSESVHVVNEILNAFKNNSRQEAKFWIHIKDKFILIRYFALRDTHNIYQGCLEVTQDISDHQTLRGDRRLLEWD